MTLADHNESPGAERRSMLGGDAIAEMLRVADVGPMFGMGGFQLLPFYEAVRSRGLPHHLINDERCGCFMADAFARVAGKPGVCDATLGPGATNLATALVESLNAGIPQIALVGGTNRDHSWKNMTQEGRQAEILRPACKELIRIEAPARIPELLRRAYAVATSGRPGPVVLEVPEDVCHAEWEYRVDDFWIDRRTTQIQARRFRPDAKDVERAAALIRSARRPMLLVGGGLHISGAYDALRRLAEEHSIPVAHTISGKGALACDHALSCGVFGRYSRIANDLIGKADLLIVAGCKLGEVATKRYQLIDRSLPVIHLEISPEEIGRTARVDVGLVGDARLGLSDLADALSGERAAAQQTRQALVVEVSERMRTWREKSHGKLTSDERPISMARLVTELNGAMPADSILVVDGGFAAHWGALLYETKSAGRRFIADRGFASIGYGLPGALGAQLAAPEHPVVAITGDGGLNMTIGELETARRIGAPITLVVVNNAASGYVKALQHAVFDGAYQSSDLIELDYARIASAFGCHGVRVEDPADLPSALRAGIEERDRPSVIDVVVTRDPSKMLPGVDNRTLKVAKGDRPV